MFDNIDFKKSIASHKIKWLDNGFSSKYFMLLLPVGWITITLIIVIKNGQLSALSTLPKPFLISLPLACLIALVNLCYIRKNDKFEEINISIPNDRLRELIKPELIKLGWKIRRSNSKFITITTRKWYTTESRAAILFNGKSAYVNVQNSIGNGAYFPFSFGKNKKLTNQLNILINSIQLNQPDLTQSTNP
jgi:hypothetical protein